MSEELKPCPFCGSPADPEGWSSIDRKGPACTNGDCDGAADSAEAWNKRASDTLIEEQAARIATLEKERDVAIEANYRQAGCIHQCSAHLGTDTSGTIEGLPLAVKHAVTRADASQARLSEAVKVMERLAEGERSDTGHTALREAAKAFIATLGENKN